MSFRTNLLAAVERIRGAIPGALDLRQHTVTVRVRTWTGARPGLIGTSKTDVDTVLTNAGYNPKVTEVSTRDIVASGGVYQQGDYRIGPLTPSYAGGGIALATVDPATTSTAREVLYKIEGQGLPSGGAWFKRVEASMLRNFTNSIVVRRTAVTP